MTVRFDEAMTVALRIAADVADVVGDVVVVRDVVGRIRLVVGSGPADGLDVSSALDGAASALSRDLGPFAPDDPILRAADLMEPATIMTAPERIVRRPRGGAAGEIAVLERTVVGDSWWQVTGNPGSGNSTSWLALYSFKGGVGRSTAAAWLAHQQAARGDCVLVVDLDLESPGVSGMLQAPDQAPEFGVVDFLVEDAVGNANGLDLIGGSQLLPPGGNGEVWVAPAAGRHRLEYQYLPKLNRIYMSAPPTQAGEPPVPFSSRVRRAVEACVSAVERRSRQPDLVILDSRAGIHDVAAVVVTELADTALLLAIDDAATWTGYRLLFEQWAERPSEARRIRERLKMVAAMVPDLSFEDYLKLFADRAASCFEILYDDVALDESDAYNPSVDDETAPHYPLPIFFDPVLRGLDLARLTDLLHSPVPQAAFDPFVKGVRGLVGRDIS
jgi:hypothetical protein